MKTAFDLNLLEELCLASGVSGFEDQVRSIIADRIKDNCDKLFSDALGNLIGVKYGENHDKKIMLCAHMDEVGFCIKHVNDDGTLLFDAIGITASALPSKRVLVGKDKVPGVIASSPVHLSTEAETLKISDLYIDVGATSAEQVQDLFGQYAVFDSDFCLFGNRLVKSKALDDRIGCAILCELTKETPMHDTYFVFSVCEETGGGGARAATNRIKPDVCLVLEGTTASDIHGNHKEDRICCLRHGPVNVFMDGGTLYDTALYEGIRNIAKRNNIPCQTKSRVAGGTDAAKIQRSSEGVRVCILSLPCRYIHTSSSVASIDDIENMFCLAKLALQSIADL